MAIGVARTMATPQVAVNQAVDRCLKIPEQEIAAWPMSLLRHASTRCQDPVRCGVSYARLEDGRMIPGENQDRDQLASCWASSTGQSASVIAPPGAGPSAASTKRSGSR